MSNPDAGIFISYRRQEASYLAGWLHDLLANHFGEARVFLDIDWIKPGVDFMQVITEAIAQSGVLLVIIGPDWLVPNRDGHRRLDNPDDPVRVEIETALHRNIRIIPLLLDHTAMPQAGDLPANLAALTRLNALRVGRESFRTDVGRLIETLAAELGIVACPVADTIAMPVDPDTAAPSTRIAGRAAPVDAQRDQQQRDRLLTKLSRAYTEYLDQSIEHDSILELSLDLDQIPEKTFRPHDQILALPERKAERLPAGTSLLEAFDKTGGLDGDGLLVLGEPGAGKTTLLFELARRLAERARADPHHPVPVYLPLSSWAARRPALDQWLVEQLNELYQIPRPLARRWTDDADLLFVLDGLDEIPDRTDRTACVKAINRFNRFGRSSRLPMVVASRPLEYDTLPVKLQLETAIGVRPLDPTVVLDELQRAADMQAVVTTVRRDPELLDLLRSPLLVGMLTLTYAGVPEAQIHATSGTPAERRHQLITDYVHRRFELDRPSADTHPQPGNAYPPEGTRAWLSALALNLTRQQQTVFLPGRTQPEWLPSPWAQWVVIAVPGLLFGLLLGLVSGLVSGLSGGPLDGLRGGLLIGLPTVLGAGMGAGLVGHAQPGERLSWSWRRARSKLRTALLVGLLAGLLYGLVSGLIDGLLDGLRGGLLIGLPTVLYAAFGAGLVGHPEPGERLSWSWRRARSKLRTALLVGLLAGLLYGLITGLIDGLIGVDGLPAGLISGLSYGLLFGVGTGLGAGLVGQPQPAERLSWSWRRARSKLKAALRFGLLVGLLGGLLGGLLVWLSIGLLYGLSFGLSFGLFVGLFVVLFVGLLGGLLVWLLGGLSKSLIPIYSTPLEGIRKSVRNGLIVALISVLLGGLIVGLIVGLLFGVTNGLSAGVTNGLIAGLSAGLIAGMIAGLSCGLDAAAQYGIFRLLLSTQHVAPLQYVRWLDYTVHLRLLYRGTSGGYVFIHRVVQEYFSDANEKRIA